MLLRKHFGKYYLKYIAFFLIGLAALVAVSYIQLRIPMRLGEVIDYLENYDGAITFAGVIDFIMAVIIEISIIVAAIFVGRFIWRFFLIGTSRRIEEDIRNQMFLHATKLPQSFYSQSKTGGLMSLFTNDLDSVRDVYGWGLLMLVDGAVLGALVLTRMFSISWEMTLIAIVPLLITVSIAVLIVVKMQKLFKKRQKSVEELSDFTQENFSGISVIKAYVKEEDQKATFKTKTKDLFQKDVGFIKYSIWVNIILGFTITFIVLIILVYGSILILNEQQNPGSSNLTTGLLTTYIFLFFNLLWPVMAITNFFFRFAAGSASAGRIGNFLNAPIEIKDENIDDSIEELSGSITVNNLTFQYPDGDTPVLKDVSFTIKSGQMVGILGKTGSGKSSLVELFLRMYNTDNDMIYFDDYDINNIAIKQLRQTIGYVPQDNFLYSDTITNNIGFAYETIDEDIIENAAKLADVYDNVVEFKEGFNTILGERGVTVSGGQKQRISIARALAKDPKILILDDSVSAVDTKTEEAIINNLMNVRQGKTTIIIAHRISTVKRLDLIVLLDKGEVIGVGSHEELLSNNPTYQEMVRRQELEVFVEGEGA